jgi:hypothetical protein
VRVIAIGDSHIPKSGMNAVPVGGQHRAGAPEEEETASAECEHPSREISSRAGGNDDL